MLERLCVKATFFVPGLVVQRHADIVRQIVAKGHEIGYHGYDHTASESLEKERISIQQCKKIFSDLLGVSPCGYRAPMYNVQPGTLELAASSGFLYSSNMHADDRPYLHETVDGDLVELPCHWVFDDSAHFFFTVQEPARRPIATPSAVMEIWKSEFDGLYTEGGLMVLVLHPQITGRVSRLSMIEQLVRHMQRQPGTLIATGSDLARIAKTSMDRK